MNPNYRKEKALGMAFGTASHRLRRAFMFRLAVKCGEADCYRCGKPIVSPEDMSLDHMEDWLYAEDPKGVFFDVENVRLSHKECNTRCRMTSKRNSSGKSKYKGVAWRKDRGKWRATVFANKKIVCTKQFDKEEDAARYYDKKALDFLGDRAITNESLGLFESNRAHQTNVWA